MVCRGNVSDVSFVYDLCETESHRLIYEYFFLCPNKLYPHMSGRGIDNSNSVFGWFISKKRISLHNTKNSQISKRSSVAKIKDVTLVDLSQYDHIHFFSSFVTSSVHCH